MARPPAITDEYGPQWLQGLFLSSSNISGLAALILIVVVVLLVALVSYALHKKRNVKAGVRVLGFSFFFEANDSEDLELKARHPH